MDGSCQLGKGIALVHGIATREGDVGIGIGLDDAHQLLRAHLASALKVPRLGIMATRTLMTAPRTIDGGPEPRTIHHRIFNNIENSNHSLNSKF